MNIQKSEYEALQAEKRDKMNARLQIWGLFFTLVGAAGFASQSSGLAPLVGLYPFLALCLARYAGHSERVMNQVKDRLFQIEQECDYAGYEHLNYARASVRKSGSHAKALRDALVVTQALACLLAAWNTRPELRAFFVFARLTLLGQMAFCGILTYGVGAILVATWRSFR